MKQKRQKMAHSEDELRRPNDPLPPGAVLRLYSMRMCPYAQVRIHFHSELYIFAS